MLSGRISWYCCLRAGDDSELFAEPGRDPRDQMHVEEQAQVALPRTLTPIEDDFLNPQCNPYTLDIYHHRRAILQALRDALPYFCGTVLDVGCGHMPYKSLLLSPPSRARRYLGVDLEANYYQNATELDLVWDGRTIPLPSSSVECAVCTEVLEHCPDPLAVLREIHRVLKPGGVLFLTIPFLWPLHDVPHDEYRYTPFTIQRLLLCAGYSAPQIRALGGWDASLATMLGLYVRRRPMPDFARRVLQRVALLPYKWLLRHDQPPDTFAKTGMITGLWALASKPAGTVEGSDNDG